MPWHQSSVYDGASKRIEISARGISETFPAQYWPGDDPCEHIAFALKYDGTDLALLAKLLPAIGADSIARWVQATRRASTRGGSGISSNCSPASGSCSPT